MKKDKKKIIPIIGAIILITIASLIIFKIYKNSSIEIKARSKYQAFITISTNSEETSKNISLNTMNDGFKSKVTSSSFNYPVFIVGNEILYLKDNTVYNYNIKSSYKDLNKILSSIKMTDKVDEKADIINYKATLNKETISDILESLFINEEVQKSFQADFTVKDNKIETFNLVIEGIEYDKITIMVKFSDIDNDYQVDTSKIDGTAGGIIQYHKYEEASKNILEIG